jgi:hypothetical protein
MRLQPIIRNRVLASTLTKTSLAIPRRDDQPVTL